MTCEPFLCQPGATAFWSFVAASGVLCAIAAYRLFATKRARAFWTRLHREEAGVGYALSFMIVLPFYVVLIGVAIELAFVMTAKIGTVHASFAAARAACVYTAVAYPDDRDKFDFIPEIAYEKADQAAIVALVPFASGFDKNQDPSEDGETYLDAYLDFIEKGGVENQVTDNYVRAKFACAENRTTVALTMVDANGQEFVNQTPAHPWREFLRAEVEYRAPFRLPFIGRLLGGESDGGAVARSIYASTTIPIECPCNARGVLGVALPWGDQ